jgi:hypothetical protein
MLADREARSLQRHGEAALPSRLRRAAANSFMPPRTVARGTEGSNPVPSSAESANPRSLSKRPRSRGFCRSVPSDSYTRRSRPRVR